jgi:hypothetical protein
VQVRYDESIASHIGPEPCVAVREDCDEASVGVRIGQPLSRESHLFWEPTLLIERKAARRNALLRVFGHPGVVVDPGMCVSSLYGNREISCVACARIAQVRPRKARSRSWR